MTGVKDKLIGFPILPNLPQESLTFLHLIGTVKKIS
jgi:hypothetical protein